ncbi:hypothetical protein AB4142_06325 [Variovorax sp. 2RAF20]
MASPESFSWLASFEQDVAQERGTVNLRPPTSASRRFVKAVLSEGVIDQAESYELKELVDYRNIILHTIHDLTGDVGAHSDLTKRDPETFKLIPSYDVFSHKG